jgi:protein phosphatase
LSKSFRAVGLSDVGRSRSHNEDSYTIDLERRFVLVADGMGGHGHGEIASSLAVEGISEFIRQREDESAAMAAGEGQAMGVGASLGSAIEAGHERVVQAVRDDESLAGMGTTAVGLMLEGNVVAVAHVGDSRAYLLRQGDLSLVTEDHTWVNEQVKAGYLSKEQARSHPLKSVVTRAIGGDQKVAVDVCEIETKPGDLYLLCSDGLTSMLSDEEILSLLLLESESLEDRCRNLVQAANDQGGLDNVTVVLLEILDE